MPRQRLVCYCQSLVGIGHLSATLRIVDALLPHVDVDLIHGGLAAGPLAPREGLASLELPALLHDEASGAFFDPAGGGDIEALWAARRTAIAHFLHGRRHDGIIVEFYPFGRRRFKSEILGLFDAVRQRSGPVPVFTSVRDVLVPRPIEHEQRVAAAVHKHIHTVLVRGDASILRLDETFSLAPEIAGKLCYTGYLGAAAASAPTARRAQVLVSQGGGDVGRELLEAAIAVAPRFPGLAFILAAGSRTPPAAIAALQRSAGSGNVRVVPFLDDFARQLAASALSINMGGDNTLVEVVGSGTPSLAYPYQDNPEQALRIRRFAERGLVQALSPAELGPDRLAVRIEAALSAPARPRVPIALDGARVTSERIRAVLESA